MTYSCKMRPRKEVGGKKWHLAHTIDERIVLFSTDADLKRIIDKGYCLCLGSWNALTSVTSYSVNCWLIWMPNSKQRELWRHDWSKFGFLLSLYLTWNGSIFLENCEELFYLVFCQRRLSKEPLFLSHTQPEKNRCDWSLVCSGQGHRARQHS